MACGRSITLGVETFLLALSDAHLVKKFRDRDKLCDAGRDRLARHVIATEELRRLSFVLSVLLAHRADFLRISPLFSNKMQDFRADEPALQNHLRRF